MIQGRARLVSRLKIVSSVKRTFNNFIDTVIGLIRGGVRLVVLVGRKLLLIGSCFGRQLGSLAEVKVLI